MTTSRSDRARIIKRAATMRPRDTSEAAWDAACLIVWQVVEHAHRPGIEKRQLAYRRIAASMAAAGEAIAARDGTSTTRVSVADLVVQTLEDAGAHDKATGMTIVDLVDAIARRRGSVAFTGVYRAVGDLACRGAIGRSYAVPGRVWLST